MIISRRDFTRTAGLACLGSVLPIGNTIRAAEPAGRKPNFLFVYTDDQRWDAMGVVQREQGGKALFPWLKTSNMDRLASEGVRFRNAFVVNSLCSPSRACFLTGQYNHLNGVKDNAGPFPVDNVTVASVLTGAGYATGYFGKWHMDGQKGKRPGFIRSASFVGQGTYFNCPFEFDGKPRSTAGYVDDVTTDFAISFITENKDKPFLAIVGLKAVHDPRTPRASDTNQYPNVERIPPPNAGAFAPFMTDADKQGKPAARGPMSQGHRQYFQTLSGADLNLGRLLDALDRLGLAEDTVVVFASDNGYYLGEHGLGDKRSAYDESLRIPILLRYPRLTAKGRTVDQMALNIDFAPTVLDLAGVAVPRGMQGRSWRPLLEGRETAGWRKAFYYEYFVDREFPKRVPVQAVRTESAKLIRYPGHDDWTEVFDLAKDPYEMTNLVANPGSAGLRDSLSKEFVRLQAIAEGKNN